MSEKLFAVLESGSKQYKVTEGLVIDIEKVSEENQGPINFDKILLVSDGKSVKIGQPYIENATISGTILNKYKDDKKIVFKFKKKTGYQKKQGHRQILTTVRIDKITT